MLCRALLTIIAISCMFSREIIVNAHDQGTQRLVQIKDLICVLILSGLQKEDLDVNLLKKLQSHNVNIDEMNNENLREECISRSTLTNNNKKIEIKTEKSREEKRILAQNKNLKDSTKAQLQTILQYLIDPKSDDRTNVAFIEEATTKTGTETENYTIFGIANMKLNNLSESIKYETPNTKNINTEIESTDDMKKPDFQKFIKLWNMYNKENTQDSIHRETIMPTVMQIVKHTPRPDVMKPNDNEEGIETEYNMKNIIMDFITKNKIISTTVLPSSTKNDMVDAISYQIERYSAANTKTQQNNKTINNVNENNIGNNIPLETLNILLNDKQRKFDVKILQNKTDEEVVKHKVKKYLNEMLWTVEQLNEPIPRNAEYIPQMPNPFQYGFKFKSPKLNKNNIFTYTVNDNVEKNMLAYNNNKIPVEMLNQIAESVKAIVLKDLKSNFSTTTQTITKTITEREPTTIQQNFQNANDIMEKFMDLFQQFKTIIEKTVTAGETKFKTAEKKATRQEYNGPLRLGYPPPMPTINPYGIAMPMVHMTPIYNNPYDQNSNLNTQLVHDSNKNNLNSVNSVHNITQVNIFHHKSEQQPAPLTIQTNSYEIPPLGIPVSKPINMVNQNIVVTTRNPFMRPRIDRQHGNIMHQELDHNNKRNPSDWLNTYDKSNRQRMYVDYNFDKFVNSNKDNRFRSKSKEKQKYTNDYNDKNQYRYGLNKSHLNKSDYERMRNRNQDIKKFHEKLERTEDSNVMDDREECCRMKVTSRKQLPLNNIKNRSRYDDTHFRNFLKTQQKVNDMLERILATKTKSDGPRTAEIP